MKLNINLNGDYGEINGKVNLTVKCIETNEILLDYDAETFTDANERLSQFINDFDDEAYDEENKYDFETFCEENEQYINEILAENGADREMDFDRENSEITLFETGKNTFRQLQFYRMYS